MGRFALSDTLILKEILSSILGPGEPNPTSISYMLRFRWDHSHGVTFILSGTNPDGNPPALSSVLVIYPFSLPSVSLESGSTESNAESVRCLLKDIFKACFGSSLKISLYGSIIDARQLDREQWSPEEAYERIEKIISLLEEKRSKRSR